MTPNRFAISLALAAAFGATPALSATLQVNASVAANCIVDNTNAQVDYVLDPLNSSGGGVKTPATQPTFRCTKGTSYFITATSPNQSGGSYYMTNGTDTIPYLLTFTSTGGTPGSGGKSLPYTMDLSVEVVDGTFDDVSTGSYSDTVTLTVTP